MAKLLLSLVVVASLLVSDSLAQSGVHEKDLKGTWLMTFDIAEEADSAAERVALSVVGGLLDWIEIRFEFLPENRLKVIVNVFGEREVEYGEWRVNERRELVLSDTDHFEAEDTFWLFEDGRLTAYEYENGERVRADDGVFLEHEMGFARDVSDTVYFLDDGVFLEHEA